MYYQAVFRIFFIRDQSCIFLAICLKLQRYDASTGDLQEDPRPDRQD